VGPLTSVTVGPAKAVTATLTVLAQRSGRTRNRVTVRTAERVLTGWVTRANGRFEAAFEPGPIGLRAPAADEIRPVLEALDAASRIMLRDACVATVGRPRLLVPVSTRAVIAALTPDFDQLRDACDRLGLLGCYAYSPPAIDGRLAARMFAPSIGVDEDIANANSTPASALTSPSKAGRGSPSTWVMRSARPRQSPPQCSETGPARSSAWAAARRLREPSACSGGCATPARRRW
jgi:trans-2,3-dihydro-3-hydroxyanthranilate isomerase